MHQTIFAFYYSDTAKKETVLVLERKDNNSTVLSLPVYTSYNHSDINAKKEWIESEFGLSKSQYEIVRYQYEKNVHDTTYLSVQLHFNPQDLEIFIENNPKLQTVAKNNEIPDWLIPSHTLGYINWMLSRDFLEARERGEV
ncbi:hypothetical protein NIES267_73700 (plasmid) [Calothrix parasitica NIES-267]|uniref:Uncharacterized protein n=1 Tax=Calothrix parasitica NIES-267 TaxID=1973488 RepID=A0A1Z4M308_9CYAN|nr:hypothetical protein NIES267_73700 [Calothrix parasitica NIES-267]